MGGRPRLGWVRRGEARGMGEGGRWVGGAAGCWGCGWGLEVSGGGGGGGGGEGGVSIFGCSGG